MRGCVESSTLTGYFLFKCSRRSCSYSPCLWGGRSHAVCSAPAGAELDAVCLSRASFALGGRPSGRKDSTEAVAMRSAGAASAAAVCATQEGHRACTHGCLPDCNPGAGVSWKKDWSHKAGVEGRVPGGRARKPMPNGRVQNRGPCCLSDPMASMRAVVSLGSLLE